jgi:hypothetical protein
MTRLVDTAQELGLNAEVSPSGRWMRFRGGQRTVNVLEALWGDDYYMWCEPLEAVRAGLRCAGPAADCR